KQPGVRFKLRNDGERTLNRVEVMVFFKDSAGKIIAEKDFNPVLVSQFGIGDSKPLRPGYIWQMDASRFYKADSGPDEWEEGAVEARITDIEFAPDDGK